MTYENLVGAVAWASKLPKSTVLKVLSHLRAAIPEAVSVDGQVSIPDLGTFRLRERKGRRIRNPQTKELMHLPASKALVFKAAKAAKARASR